MRKYGKLMSSNKSLFLMCILCYFILSINNNVYAGGLPWPTEISNHYKGGFSLYSGHDGMDITASSGSNLYSPISGTATYYQRYRPLNGDKVLVSYGNYVEIDNGYYTIRICHMSEFSNVGFRITDAINAKDYWTNDTSGTLKTASWNSNTDVQVSCGSIQVATGQFLGKSGGSGRSTGPHLHVTLLVNGNKVDPYSYFDDTVCAKDFYPQDEYTILDYGNDFYAYLIYKGDGAWRHIENIPSNDKGTAGLVGVAGERDNYDPKQIWHFLKQDDGSYKIFNCYDDYILDIDSANTSGGARIQSWPEDNGGDQQRWYIVETKYGKTTLKSKYSDLVMHNPGASDVAGNLLEGYPIDDCDAQDFTFWKLTDSGVDYSKPQRPDKIDAGSCGIVVTGNNVQFSWPNAPLKSEFDNRVYDVRVFKGEQCLDDKCIWGTNGTIVDIILDEPGTYTFTVASVNSKYYEWYRISDGYSLKVGEELTSECERILPDGDYLIAAARAEDRASFYYLDIDGKEQPAANETNVSLCGPLGYDPPSYEIWTLAYEDGFYTIRQKGTEMCLDVYNSSAIEGGNVQVYKGHGGNSQKWMISSNGLDGYRIQAKCSGLSLDIWQGKIENGTNVCQWRNNDGAAQAWMFIPYHPEQTLPEGRYMILSSVDNSYEIDLPGNTGDLDNGANAQIWKSDETLSQYNSFDIRKLENGYYKIIHAASGKELNSLEGKSTFGQNIGLYQESQYPAGEWAITGDSQDGSYVLRTRCSGMVLDLDGGITENGRNVQQWSYNGTKAQMWKFVRAEYTVKYDANGGEAAPEVQTKYYKTDITLSSIAPIRNGYEFLGWGKTADAVSAVYEPGDMYGLDADLMLYAIWKELKPDLVLPASLNVIEEEAFSGGAFTYVQLAEGTRSIGSRAFANCDSLRHIFIPETTTTIASSAFENVDKSMTIHGAEGSYAEFYANKYGFRFMAE